MPLKNVTRIKTVKLGEPSWLLLDHAGAEISAFSVFAEKNLEYPFTTRKRYAEVVAQFIDYLIEAGAFGVTTSQKHLNTVIDAYPTFLRDGSDTVREKLRKTINDFPQDSWFLRVASSLKRSPLKPASFSNTLAGINRFLRLSECLADEAFQKARLAGIDTGDSLDSLITALAGNSSLSEREKMRLRQNSVLGGVIRFKTKGLQRPARLKCRPHTAQIDRTHLDFPIECVPELARTATSKRDKAIWLLLAASGVRASEGLNMQWSDVIPENLEVFILDPRGRRLGGDLTPREQIRFKGRAVSWTYLIYPFRQHFFQALEEYLKEEYLPSPDPCDAAFIFQYVDPLRRAIPYVSVSFAALNANFRAACQRISPMFSPAIRRRLTECTIHSLRHMYGVYMVNDYPVDPAAGLYGLSLAEVQVLMGHKDIRSTSHYARQDRNHLSRKLIRADNHLFGPRECLPDLLDGKWSAR